MWKVTRKGLAAHKLRFVLTALAVMLGVAFMSGTFVLTATIQQTFDDLFANIYSGTDAVVRGPRSAQERLRVRSAAERPGVARRRRAEDADRRSRRRATYRRPYAQIVDSNGKAIGATAPPTFGLGWNPNRS